MKSLLVPDDLLLFLLPQEKFVMKKSQMKRIIIKDLEVVLGRKRV